MSDPPVVGVLALQGAFALHREVLERLGARVELVRRADQLDAIDRLVLPGGESTTMSMLAERSGLIGPLTEFVGSGRPVLGTCAGAILLSAQVLDGRDDQRCLGAIEMVTRRNGFGRQVDSFTTGVAIDGLEGGEFPAVCIRAPVVESVGDRVEVLARIDGRPAMARQGAIMVTIFHPELAEDARVHEWFLNS